MNEPTTIREYIAARREATSAQLKIDSQLDRSDLACADKMILAELHDLERWLDAHEPKAVGGETEVESERFELAKLALQGMLANPVYTNNTYNEVVEFAFVFADTILAEHKKGQP